MLLSVLLRERCCRRPAHIQYAHWYFFVNNFNWQLLEPTNTSVGSMGIEDQLYVLQKGAERHAGPGQTCWTSDTFMWRGFPVLQALPRWPRCNPCPLFSLVLVPFF